MDDMEACSLTLWGHVGLLFVAWQCSDKYLLIRGSHFKPAHLLSSMSFIKFCCYFSWEDVCRDAHVQKWIEPLNHRVMCSLVVSRCLLLF